MTDPRAGDVAGAERLFAEAREQGVARLPVLSAGELWVLCGDRQVLADEDELRWWTGLTDERRSSLAVAVTDFMTFRGLLRTDGPVQLSGAADLVPPELPMTPDLATVIAARQYPAIVVTCTQGNGSADDSPRMYGLAASGGPLELIVSEFVSKARDPKAGNRPFGPHHHFSLLSAGRAARVLALWATEQNGGRSGLLGKLGRKNQERVIDIYRNKPGEQLRRDRVLVGPASEGGHEVSIGTRSAAPGEPVAYATDKLTGLLMTMLADELP